MSSEIRFSDGARHLYYPELNTVSRLPEGGLRSWLATHDDFYLAPPPSEDCFVIELYDKPSFTSYLAYDINRLSCAFLETVANIVNPQKHKKFLAWDLIRYYYSAFFSAHSILKILGFGLVQISAEITRNLCTRASILGYSNTSLKRGIYCLSTDRGSNRVVFYRVKKYDENHKGLWTRFADFLQVLSGLAIVTGHYDSNCITPRSANAPRPLSLFEQLPSLEAGILSEVIDDLRNGINTSGDFNWLSSIRNSINYNHGYGIWYPYHSYSSKYDRIQSLNSLCLNVPPSSCFDTKGDEALVKFVKICQLINAINLDLLTDLCDRHPSHRSFLKNGFFSYKKLYVPL